MDINKPSYNPYSNNSKVKSYIIHYDELPIGWRIHPPLNIEKRIKYASSEKEHNSKVYQYIADTTNLFQEMCNDGWVISKWCKNDPINHCSDEKANFRIFYNEKKAPFPYANVSDYGKPIPEIGGPSCIMEKKY